MDQQYDPRSVFMSLHSQVTNQLLQLLDGFYFNVEDGLFEIAYRDGGELPQRRCFDLMRELRYLRGNIMRAFTSHMQRGAVGWFQDVEESVESALHDELSARADLVSMKASAHFSVLLQNIAERTAYGTERDTDKVDLPISPYRISYNFLRSCASMDFDAPSLSVVQDLFARFVLDRTGGIYGECNRILRQAGFPTVAELTEASLEESTAV